MVKPPPYNETGYLPPGNDCLSADRLAMTPPGNDTGYWRPPPFKTGGIVSKIVHRFQNLQEDIGSQTEKKTSFCVFQAPGEAMGQGGARQGIEAFIPIPRYPDRQLKFPPKCFY